MPYLMYIKVKVSSVKHFLFGQNTLSDGPAFCARLNEGEICVEKSLFAD